jgi:hypothetical protein
MPGRARYTARLAGGETRRSRRATRLACGGPYGEKTRPAAGPARHRTGHDVTRTGKPPQRRSGTVGTVQANAKEKP